MDQQNNNGWVAIGRNITQLQGYFGEPFSRGQCLVDLHLIAEWKSSRTFFVRGNNITLHRGQIAISIRDLSARWHLCTKTVERRLKEFEMLDVISIKRSSIINIITVLDYHNSDTAEMSAYEGNTTVGSTLNTTLNTTQNTTQSTTQNTTLSLKIEKKEKEREKTSSSSRARGLGQEVEGSVSLWDYFFAENRRGSLEQLCMTWHIDRARLEALAKECLIEWDVTGKDYRRFDATELSAQLLRHMQGKLKYQRSNPDNDYNRKRDAKPEFRVVTVDGQQVTLGPGEEITPNGRTHNGVQFIPLSAKPRPSVMHWWSDVTQSWETY